MGREGRAVRSCGRVAFKHTRFAVWPARRANGAGIVLMYHSSCPCEASMSGE